MPAYQLYVYEDREKREALEQKICEQVDACTEVNGTIRNRIKKFLIEEGITDISEMDAVLRVRYEEYLERNETVLAPITCLRGFDGIVIHRMKEELQTLAGRRNYTTEYQEQWMCLTKPWIPVSDNFEKINVKKQKQDRDSILEFYKKLIMLRKEKEVIARGNIEFMEVENAGVLAYTRCLDKQKLLVCCNFRDVESQMEFTQEWKSGRKILGNYEENHKNNYKVLTLRPYEIIVLEKGEE